MEFLITSLVLAAATLSVANLVSKDSNEFYMEYEDSKRKKI